MQKESSNDKNSYSLISSLFTYKQLLLLVSYYLGKIIS